MLYFTVPKGMISSSICSAIFGAIYLLALLFTIPNVTEFMNLNRSSNQTINLAVANFTYSISNRGVLALTILLIINVYFGGASSLTVTSRIGSVCFLHR